MKEDKTTAASYLLNFYKTIQELNNSFVNYNNIIIEIKSQCGEEYEQLKGLTPQQKELYQTQLQELRYYIQQTYIQYLSISMALNIKDEKSEELENLKKEVVETYIIKIEPIEKFVILINSFLMKGVVKDLLTTSSEMIEGLYE